MIAAVAPTTARLVGARRSFAGGAVQAPRAALPRRRAARALPQVARAAATSTATYICIDCGYIYDGSEGPFDKLPRGYSCPVCNAPKRRFKAYAGAAGNKKNDQKSMNARWQKLQAGEGLDSAAEESGSSTGLIIGGVAGAVALAALYFYLSAQYN